MRKKIWMRLTLMVSIVSTTLVLGQNSIAAKSANAPSKAVVKTESAKQQPDIGERKFEANCSRCHSAPEQLSPSITGTVVRHMRVRASLSAQDEKDILKYLAP